MTDTEAPVSSRLATFRPANDTFICGRLYGLAIAAALNSFPGCVAVLVTRCSNYYQRVALSGNRDAGDHILKRKNTWVFRRETNLAGPSGLRYRSVYSALVPGNFSVYPPVRIYCVVAV